MGFKFRQSIKILPGVRLNLSGRGISASVGMRGLRYTVGAKGSRITAGIPGTGLSWSQYQPHERVSVSSVPANIQPPTSEILLPIENAAAPQISALSSSELASVLGRAQSRWRIAPVLQVSSMVLFAFSIVQGSQPWMIVSAVYGTIFVFAALALDRYRRSVKVVLEPQEAIAQIADAILDSFQDLIECHSVWRIQAEGKTTDWKRNAGANGLCRRTKIRPGIGRPACMRGKARFPTLKLGAEEIYLLPDAALFVAKGGVAAVSYHALTLSSRQQRFVEDEGLPKDAVIVDHTWRYVNKNGGPDARFNSNKQLPICLYGELSFQSDGGLNSKIQYSNPEAADRLCRVVDVLHRTTASFPKIVYVRSPKTWPSMLFWVCAVAFGACQLLFIPSVSQPVVQEGRPQLTVPVTDKSELAPAAPIKEGDPRRLNVEGGPRVRLDASPRELPPEVVPLPRSRPKP